MQMENLRALVMGRELNPCQKKLAQKEFVKLENLLEKSEIVTPNQVVRGMRFDEVYIKLSFNSLMEILKDNLKGRTNFYYWLATEVYYSFNKKNKGEIK